MKLDHPPPPALAGDHVWLLGSPLTLLLVLHVSPAGRLIAVTVRARRLVVGVGVFLTAPWLAWQAFELNALVAFAVQLVVVGVMIGWFRVPDHSPAPGPGWGVACPA